MPQNNVLPDWRATYPNDAPVQKPPGVTVSTTATAPRVPNKPTYSAGTIQSYDVDLGKMMFKEIVERVTEDKPKAKDDPKKPAKPDDDDDDDDEDEAEEEEEEEEASSKKPTPPHRR